jgi:hypothetical protein
VGDGAGLPSRETDGRTNFAAMSFAVRRVFSGDTVLGSLRLGRASFAALPGIDSRYGLLGFSLLARYRIQVVPGERLALRPRGDLWETAPQRIARWPWARGCEHLGCIQAHIERTGDAVELALSFDVDHPHPTGWLLGCHAWDAAGRPLRTMTEQITSGGPIPGMAGTVAVTLPMGVKKNQIVRPPLLADARWKSAMGYLCRDLDVLEVTPIKEALAKRVDLVATPW